MAMNDKFLKLKNAWDIFDRYCDEPMKERVELYDIYYEISTQIYDYRISRGWSQKKLAEVLGITQAMVSKLESGEYNYTIEQLWKISKKLGWTLNVSFDGACEDSYSVGYNAENQIESNISPTEIA
jgi:transcriptional regulator with XRE-family HTH domain